MNHLFKTSMDTVCIFVRHARSQASVWGIVQGQGLDIPLAEDGRKHAQSLAQHLKGVTLDHIFSSTAQRARETASAIRQFHPHVPYEELPELNERSKGQAEGMYKEEFERRFSQIVRQWKDEIDARPVGGENFEDVEKRVIPVITEHVRTHEGATLLYVAHGNVIKIILGHALGVPLSLRARISQDYCAVNRMRYNTERKRWEVDFINRACR